MKFLSTKLLCLILIGQSYAVAESTRAVKVRREIKEFASRIKEDRAEIFEEICRDAMERAETDSNDNTNARYGLCGPYSKRITGTNFREILNSMNREFKNIRRRNRKTIDVKLSAGQLKKAFEDFTDEKKYQVFFLEGKNAYAKRYGEPKVEPKPVLAKEPVVRPKEPVVRVEDTIDLLVRDFDSSVDLQTKLANRFKKDTPTIVKALCSREVKLKADAEDGLTEWCESLGLQLKGDTLGNIHKTLNIDEDLDINIPMKNWKDVYFGVAKKHSGFTDEELEAYKKYLDESAKVVTVADPAPVIPQVVDNGNADTTDVVTIEPVDSGKTGATDVVTVVEPINGGKEPGTGSINLGNTDADEVVTVVDPNADANAADVDVVDETVVPEDDTSVDKIDLSVLPEGFFELSEEDKLKQIPLTKEQKEICDKEEFSPEACIKKFKAQNLRDVNKLQGDQPEKFDLSSLKHNLRLKGDLNKTFEALVKQIEELEDDKLDQDIEMINDKYEQKYKKTYIAKCKDKKTKQEAQDCVDEHWTEIFTPALYEYKDALMDYQERNTPSADTTGDDTDGKVEPGKTGDEVVTVDPVESDDSAQLEVPQSKLSCDDQMTEKILDLLKKDEYNMIGKQFQLTSLKLALQVLQKSARYDTVEDYLKKYQKGLLSKDNKEVYNELVNFYRDHGKVEDTNFIADNFEKLKNSSYWKKDTRVYNETASVFILADSLSNEDSKFSELDAAATWFAEQVNKKFPIGSYHNNLTNLTSLTYRQLGVLKKERPIKLANLERRIGEKEKELDGQYEQMKAQMTIDLAHCFQGKNACISNDEFNQRFSASLMSLTQRLKENDKFNVEMDRSLKGTLTGGGFKIDFLPRDRDI